MVNEVDIITQEALRRYFSILSKKGYYNYADTSKIMLLIAIQQLLESDMAVFINHCDKKVIDRALNILYCSICPISTPMYNHETNLTVIGESENLN